MRNTFAVILTRSVVEIFPENMRCVFSPFGFDVILFGFSNKKVVIYPRTNNFFVL